MSFQQTIRKHIFPVLLGLTFCLSFAACKISLIAKKTPKVLSADYCVADYADGLPASYTNPDSIIIVSKILSGKMNAEDLRLANTIGILRQIKDRFSLSKSPTNKDLLRIRDLDVDIENRITYAGNVLNGISAALRCESERTGRVADYLDELGKKRINKFTVGAVIAGAVTGVAPLIIKEQQPQNAVVITGSALSAGLGIAALTNNRKKIQLSFQKNLLSDIWYVPGSSKVYPKFVWLMLNEPNEISDDPKTSVVGRLKKRWLNFEFDQKLSDHLRVLLFDNGGVFTEAELNTRQALLNQLSTEMQLLNVKLLTLSLKLKTY